MKNQPDLAVLLSTLFVNILFILFLVTLLWIPRSAPMVAKVVSEIWSVDIGVGERLPSYLSGPVQTPKNLTEKCWKNNKLNNHESELIFPTTSPTPMRITLVSVDDNRFSATFTPITGVTDNRSDKHYAFLQCGSKSYPLLEELIFIYKLPSAKRHTILASGTVRIGRLPNDALYQEPRLLISGEVIATAFSYPFKSGRAEVRSPLTLGDEVKFFTTDDSYISAPSNIIAVYESELHAFQMVVRSKAARAEVYQFGTNQGYPIISAPSIWARLQAQAEWTIFLGILTVMLNIVGAVRHYRVIIKLRAMARNSENSDLTYLAD